MLLTIQTASTHDRKLYVDIVEVISMLDIRTCHVIIYILFMLNMVTFTMFAIIVYFQERFIGKIEFI